MTPLEASCSKYCFFPRDVMFLREASNGVIPLDGRQVTSNTLKLKHSLLPDRLMG